MAHTDPRPGERRRLATPLSNTDEHYYYLPWSGRLAVVEQRPPHDDGGWIYIAFVRWGDTGDTKRQAGFPEWCRKDQLIPYSAGDGTQ